MNKIKFKGKEYPTRTFIVKWSPENPTGELQIVIAPESLSVAMGFSREGWKLDEGIYHYVEDENINKPAKEICERYLDTKIELISEVK